MRIQNPISNIKGLTSEQGMLTAQTLIEVVHLKDIYTGGHSVRVGTYTRRIAEALNLGRQETDQIALAATLHDIGKIGIPDAILLKEGSLDADEWVHVKRHCEYGWSILRHIAELEPVGLMLLHHHERYDGFGYPVGLAGEQIPLGSRVISVADAYDAMTTDRPYRKALGRDIAMEELRRCAGTQFDPIVVEAFCASMGSRPKSLQS